MKVTLVPSKTQYNLFNVCMLYSVHVCVCVCVCVRVCVCVCVQCVCVLCVCVQCVCVNLYGFACVLIYCHYVE